MLKTILRAAAAVALIGIATMSATSLRAVTSTYFYRCPFPSCVTAPNYTVQCRLHRTGAIHITTLKRCCCEPEGDWTNLYRIVNR